MHAAAVDCPAYSPAVHTVITSLCNRRKMSCFSQLSTGDQSPAPSSLRCMVFDSVASSNSYTSAGSRDPEFSCLIQPLSTRHFHKLYFFSPPCCTFETEKRTSLRVGGRPVPLHFGVSVAWCVETGELWQLFTSPNHKCGFCISGSKHLSRVQ